MKYVVCMSNDDSQLAPRFEVRIHWEAGGKRYTVHDLQQEDRLVGSFDSIKDASVQCALLWLEHVRAVRRGSSSTPPPLTSLPSQKSAKGLPN
jgi:hypothetical protein